jgi:hypothetical protein
VHQNAIAFQENTIYVRLRNRGRQTASGTVGVFWAHSRIGWPCKSGAPNVGSIAFKDLAPGEVRIVLLAWVPQAPGHHRLHTIIDAVGDPANWSAPCSPHRPRWDNNVSWRNVIAYFHPPKVKRQLQEARAAEVELVNPYAWSKEVDVIMGLKAFPPTATITVQLAEHVFERWQEHEGHWSQGVEAFTKTRCLMISGEVTETIGGIPLNAHERATATLIFGTPSEGAFEVTFQERIEDLLVGGVSYR